MRNYHPTLLIRMESDHHHRSIQRSPLQNSLLVVYSILTRPTHFAGNAERYREATAATEQHHGDWAESEGHAGQE